MAGPGIPSGPTGPMSSTFWRGHASRSLQVTLADLQGFADSLGELAPASRYRTLSAIKSLLAFAHRTGYLPYDVGRALRLPAVRSRLAERILPEADLHRILSLEANPRNRAILTLLYASGMRVSELCGLCWRDLQPNSDGGQVTVLGKGGVTRAVKIPASVWKLVNGLRGAKAEPGDPVFRSRKKGNGGVLRPLAVLRWCARQRHAPASNCRSRPTGSGTRTLLMLLTAARRFIWCRPPSDTPASPPPAATSTPAPTTAPAASSHSKAPRHLDLRHLYRLRLAERLR